MHGRAIRAQAATRLLNPMAPICRRQPTARAVRVTHGERDPAGHQQGTVPCTPGRGSTGSAAMHPRVTCCEKGPARYTGERNRRAGLQIGDLQRTRQPRATTAQPEA